MLELRAPSSSLPYTLPFSVCVKSFIFHSYENCRGVGGSTTRGVKVSLEVLLPRVATRPTAQALLSRVLLVYAAKIVKVTAASFFAAAFGAAAFLLCAESLLSGGQQTDPAKPVVVQPGAPGEPSRTLPSSTKPALPPLSQADVEFMQGMIMHHAQAVEMTALIASHTKDKDLHLLGARISRSQTDEIKFMKRWLAVRGQPLAMLEPSTADSQHAPASGASFSGTGSSAGGAPMQSMDMSSMSHSAMHLMPGMLTAEQMEALRRAKGAEFDRLFLTGMIQHHNGALSMVKALFDSAGAGQDAELFNFATDVDTGQRAEIRIMQGILERDALEEKR